MARISGGVVIVSIPALLMFSQTVVAQQASGIAGVVRDTSGGVLPGVTVEAASPALIEKVRAVVVSLPLAGGQSPTNTSTLGTAAKAGPALKTSWGDPDLQGIWNDPYQTPLQRPAKYAGREFFTEAEVAELDKQRAAILRQDPASRRGANGTSPARITRSSSR